MGLCPAVSEGLFSSEAGDLQSCEEIKSEDLK